MGQIAFVFSGQGDQHPGMGQDLYEQSLAAAAVFDLCDQIRPGTKSQCFNGSEEALKETVNTQPCLYAFELAAAAYLAEKGLRADAAAGFSLGEVAAAAYCGAFDTETGFKLVTKRGELMQRDAQAVDTAMAAVLRLDPEQVAEICSHYGQIYPVNFNCPGQITVSGLASEMPAFTAEVKEARGRALPLKVKGAFHSPFMAAASADFADVLREALTDAGSAPAIPLYSNRTALPYPDDPAQVPDLLSQQIVSPVLWEKTIRNMMDAGIDTFIEIGPGKTLTNMIKKISKDVTAVSFTQYGEAEI